MADQEDIELLLLEAEERMQKSIDFFKHESDSLRTGRANPGMIEDIRIDLYGTEMPLKQLANITVPEARLLVVQPFDRSALASIEKELQKADLGLTPANDGTVIRLPDPAMTNDRRQEMVKRLHRLREDAHVAVRNVRRDVLEQFRGMEKGKEMSQDDLRRSQEQLQKVTDLSITKADQVSAQKESELTEV